MKVHELAAGDRVWVNLVSVIYLGAVAPDAPLSAAPTLDYPTLAREKVLTAWWVPSEERYAFSSLSPWQEIGELDERHNDREWNLRDALRGDGGWRP